MADISASEDEDFGPAFKPVPDAPDEDFGPAFKPVQEEDFGPGFQPAGFETGPVPQRPNPNPVPEGFFGRMFTEGVPSEDGTSMVHEPNEILRTMTNFGFQLGGAIYGAKLGARRGPIGGALGAIGGTGLGIIAGVETPDMMMRIYEGMSGNEKWAPTLTYDQSFYLYRKEAEISAAFSGAISGFKFGQRVVTRAMMNIPKEAWGQFNNAREAYIHLAPFHVASPDGGIGQRIITGYTAAVSGVPFLGNAIRRKHAQVVQEIDAAVNRLPGLYSGVSYSFPDIGQAIHKDASYLLAQREHHWRSVLDPIENAISAGGGKVAPYNSFAAGEEIAQRFKERALVPLTGNKAAEQAAKEAEELAKAAEIPEVAIVIKRMEMMGARETGIDMSGQAASLPATVQLQPFMGMKDFARQIQAAMWKLDKGTPRKLFADLLEAVNKDMADNVRGSPEVRAQAAELQAQLREFSLEATQLFEKHTMKALGLEGREMPDLMDVNFKRWGKFAAKADPQAVTELSRLMSPETMEKIARSYLEHALERSVREEPGKGRVFDVSRWGKILGIGSVHGPEQMTRLQTTQKVLELGGDKVPVSHLEAVYEAAQLVAGAPVRDMNTYLARRTGLAGVQGVVGAALPGVTAAKGNALASILHFGMLMGPAVFMNGIVTNHAAMRPILENIPQKATAVVKAAAWAQAARVAYNVPDAVAREGIRQVTDRHPGLRPDERLAVPDLKDLSYARKFDMALEVMTDLWAKTLQSLEDEDQ